MKALNMANAVTESFFGNDVSVIFGRKWKIAQNFDPLNSKITDNYINKETFLKKALCYTKVQLLTHSHAKFQDKIPIFVTRALEMGKYLV